ncbi:Nucleic acid-binding, OB-fold [Sesbania bispinosa]|nr:Nucleic acid-binding, OB-fold [Sesbania bispinosa]
MSRRVIYLSEIVSGRVDWKIRVKVIRLWNGTDFVDRNLKNTIEMVFVDEKGTRMQCNIKKALMASFENVFPEGSGYLIQNIMVAHNDGRYKTCPHRFKLSFMANTRIDKSWAGYKLIDRVGLKLFGKSVAEMIKSKQNGFHDELPPEIDMLVDKLFVFKVEGGGGQSKFKQTFNIKYMSDDVGLDFVEYEHERNSEMADNNAEIVVNLKELTQVNITETPTNKQVSKRSHESAEVISIIDDDGSQTSSRKIPKLVELNEPVMKLKDVKKEPSE